MACTSCEMLNINGVNAHERGCPDAWRDTKVDCPWCDRSFVPEEQDQAYCDESCAAAYNGSEDDGQPSHYEEMQDYMGGDNAFEYDQGDEW